MNYPCSTDGTSPHNNNMIQLMDDVSALLTYASKLKNRSGEDFNLFTLLGVEYEEASTHSAILSDLLNPKGSHGQGDIYLKLYLEEIGVIDFDTAEANVIQEYAFYNKENSGRIDILINDVHGNSIIIENKINAEEQKDQLTRYRENFPNATIVYLTLLGEEHESADINQAYRVGICNWLDSCRKASVDLPVIREAIAQYSHLIKRLTDQHINSVMDSDIQQRILRDEDSLANFLALTNYFGTIRDKIHVDFVTSLTTLLNETYGLKTEELSYEDILDNSRYAGYFYENDKLKEKNICIGIQFDGTNKKNCYVGFAYDQVGNKDQYSYDWFYQKMEEDGITPNTNSFWLHWEFLTPLRHWGDYESLLKMYNNEGLAILERKIDFLMGLID